MPTAHRPAAFIALAVLAAAAPARAQPTAGPPFVSEPLLEAPIHHLPASMTYEEYVDATRRISLGLLYAPIPGGVHFYGGERTTGWILVGTVGAGLAAAIGGVFLIGSEGKLKDSDFGLVEVDGVVYERVPVEQKDDGTGATAETTYELRKLGRELKRPGGIALIAAGAIVVAGSYLFDIFHGMATIERKRDAVRHKYGVELGKQASLDVTPLLDPAGGTGGLAMRLSF
jgi:hypothetical protein